MSNSNWVSNSMSNWMSNSMNNWSSVDNRSSMNNWGSIGWSSLNDRGFGVDSSSFIGNISNITIISISMVVHMLGTAIRKSNGVGSRDSSCTISSLFSIESSLRVVISNSVSVGVRRRLIRVSWLSSMVSRGNLDNWSSMDNWGVISRGSVDNGGSMDNWSMNCMCNRSMDSMNSMSNWSMHSMHSVSNRSMHSMDSMSSNWNNSSMSNSNRLVSSNSRLDLSETLGVVYLRDRGMSSSESF